MTIGDAFKLDMYQLFAGQRMMNSLTFSRKTNLVPSQAEALALAQDWKEFIRPFQCAQLTHTGWKLTQLSGDLVDYVTVPCKPSGGLSFEGVYTGVVVGTLAGDALPPQCARVTTFMTGLTGRSRRGRFYMAGIVEGVTADGAIGSGDMTAQQAAWDAQFAKFSPAGTNLVWTHGVWSHTIATGCKPAAAHPHAIASFTAANPADAFKPVTQYKPRAIIYTQRRRTIGVGA